MPSRWNSTWLRAWARTSSTGSSVSARIRPSSARARAGITTETASTGSRIVDRPDGDPVVVRGGERQLAALEPGEDAGQDRAGLVARGGEDRLLEGVLQDLLGDPRRRPLAGGLDRRELLGVDALDVGREAAAAEVEGVGALELEVDLLRGRQAAHEVGEEAGRDGGGAVGLDLAGDPVGDPDLEVRRGQLEAGVLGPEQDVGQHGQGAAAGDRPRDDREAARQVLLHDREFHVGLSPGRAVRPAAGPAGSRRWSDGTYLSSHHHRHIAVETGDRRCSAVRRSAWTRRRSPWTATLDRGRRAADGGRIGVRRRRVRGGSRRAIAHDSVPAGGREPTVRGRCPPGPRPHRGCPARRAIAPCRPAGHVRTDSRAVAIGIGAHDGRIAARARLRPGRHRATPPWPRAALGGRAAGPDPAHSA